MGKKKPQWERPYVGESEIARELSKTTGLKHDVIRKMLIKYHRIVLRRMLEGDTIRFTYIGLLRLKKTSAYIGWDPFNNWEMVCPPITHIRLKATGKLHREIRKNDARKAFPLHQGPPEGYNLDFELPTRKRREKPDRGNSGRKMRTVWSRNGKSRQVWTL